MIHSNRKTYAKRAKARELVQEAEAALGSLSDGQRRDLLKDNTTWDSRTISELVDYLRLPLDR